MASFALLTRHRSRAGLVAFVLCAGGCSAIHDFDAYRIETLLNFDLFKDSCTSSSIRAGKAAIGHHDSDFWNSVVTPMTTSGKLTLCKDQVETADIFTADGIKVTDPIRIDFGSLTFHPPVQPPDLNDTMLADYGYCDATKSGSACSTTVHITGLAKGKYDVYAYGRGADSGGAYLSASEFTLGSTTVDLVPTTNSNQLTEKIHYAAFLGVAVNDAAGTIDLHVAPTNEPGINVNPYAVLNGLQINYTP